MVNGFILSVIGVLIFAVLCILDYFFIRPKRADKRARFEAVLEQRRLDDEARYQALLARADAADAGTPTDTSATIGSIAEPTAADPVDAAPKQDETESK